MLLNQYLPPFITQTDTFSGLLYSEQEEIDLLNKKIQDLISQCFVATAIWGLPYWESFVGIQTDISKDIEYRRSCVLAKIRGVGTVSVDMIKKVAFSFNNGEIQIIEHPSTYCFEIKFISHIGIPSNMADLKNVIDQIKPAHLAVIYTYLYGQWSGIKNKTWQTIKTHTWNDVLNGVI